MNLFGTDGIRGVANGDLTWQTAFKLGRAMGIYLSPGQDLCIGKDTRASGDMLEAAVSAGVTSTGRNIVRFGVITTPGLSYLVKKMGLGGGVMISASHNPSEYNGLKVFGPDGKKIPDATEEMFSRFIGSDTFGDVYPTGRDIGRIIPGEGAVGLYMDFLCGVPKNNLSGFKVALDTANGSTSAIACKVWARLGADVDVMNCAPDGHNINDGCGSTHPEALSKRIASAPGRFDAGFAFDGDGDRCIAFDETGAVLDGDHIMAILASDMAASNRLSGGTVVGTVMTNYGLEVELKKHGLKLERTPVGDRWVLEKMEECGFKLGGEQSGHIIVRDVLWAGDGIVTSLLVSDVMARSGKKLSELGAMMRSVPQHLVNVKAKHPRELARCEAVKQAISEAQARLGDRGRVVVRPSGTEPVVRIMVECFDSDMVESCIQYLEEVIRKEGEEEED